MIKQYNSTNYKIFKFEPLPVLLACFLSLQAINVLASENTKPPRPVDDWKGTNFNTASSASVSAELPFDPSVHAKMTPSGALCSEQLNAAIYRQDILHAFESYAHYDNCAFKSTSEYIQSLLKQSDKYFRQVPDKWDDKTSVPQEILDGMLTLGQVLHAIQDFYAHSNYVELVQKLEPVPAQEQDIPIVHVWTKEGYSDVKKLVTKGLFSGRVWWTLPHNCSADVPTHGELAKDSIDTVAGARDSIWNRAVGTKKQKNYTVAYNLAHRSTRDFLQWSGVRWSVIEKYCGKTLKYIVIKDRRQADLPEVKQQ